MAKVMISLPEEFLIEIDNAARAEHRTRSDLIREALRKYLKSEKQFQKPTKNPHVREAVDQYPIKKEKRRDVEEAVDSLLSFPETPAPEDCQSWGKEYLEKKNSCSWQEFVRQKKILDLIALSGKIEVDYDWEKEEEREMESQKEREKISEE